jgi:hypothetical protein
VRKFQDALLTFFELVTYGAGVLLLPCSVGDLLFGWDLCDVLLPVMVVAVPCTLILTGVALHHGWYYDHLSGWGFDSERVEPTLPRKEGRTDFGPPTRMDFAPLERQNLLPIKAILSYQARRKRPNASARDRASPGSRPDGARSKVQILSRSDQKRS